MRNIILFALTASLLIGLFVQGCAAKDANLITQRQDAIAGTQAPGGGAKEKNAALSFDAPVALEGGATRDYSDRKEKELRETRLIYSGYPEATGVKLRIEAIRVIPSVADPGDTVDIRIKYAVLTPREEIAVPVSEIREILFEGARIREAVVNIERHGGTWRSSVPITLPRNAAPGSYKVIASVRTPDGEQDAEEVTFSVR